MNFIEQIIEEDIRNGKNDAKVQTRFPPEPNGYLHIGHAKSICINFGMAEKYNGLCNLRFDDTNPVKEDTEYVDSIREDIHWLGFQWAKEFYASDYFDQLYLWAEQLINEGLAYVDDQTQEEISKGRGVPTAPGIESPYRNRSVEENLDLFRRMRAGEFPDGSRVLRAKIDMASPNMHFRDPIMYRILHATHHRTGDKWCIYPMYDFAHGQSDSIEGITHMSKRKLLQLVKEHYVNGWDDPRMPTICGLRRRGYTPASIRNFAETVGVAKRDNIIDVSLLEFCAREDLNKTAIRTMAVLDPVKLIIDNYPEGQVEEMTAVNNPEDLEAGTRTVPFSKELWIERADFRENADKKFYRLSIDREVRLKYAYIIKCTHIVKDDAGNITEIHCTYDPNTKSGMPDSNRKVKATIHWASVQHSKKAEVRLFDRLFSAEDPDNCAEGETFLDHLNPNSLVVTEAWVEPTLTLEKAMAIKHFQFERLGYFYADPDSTEEKLVFNKTVSLKQ